MSLEARFRQALADTITEVQGRLASEFDAALAGARAEADESRHAAVAEARVAVQAELQSAFDAEKTALATAQTQARADADATIDAIRAELRDAQAAALRLREEHEAALARFQSEHAASLGDLQVALESATRGRDDGAAEAARLLEAHTADTARLREEHAAELAAVNDAHAAALARLADEHAAEVSRLTAQADATAAEQRSAFDTTIARMRDEFDAATAQARELAEAALATLRTEAADAVALHSQAVDAHQSGALRLLESVRTLDGAGSLTEVLDALTTGASREAARAAMLVVKGDRLIGWRTVGFGALDQDARVIESSTGDVGALAAAVNTARPALVGAGSVLSAPAFAGASADCSGLAVPLLVAGRPVAVLYADAGTDGQSTAWTSPVEVLVRHAARCLEGLAVHRATAPKAAPVRVGAA